MKTKRTIRTLRRAGVDPKTIGFAGFLPTGKYVRSHARLMRAEKALAKKVPSRVYQSFTVTGVTQRGSVKALTRWLNSPVPVQAAWAAS